MKRILKIILIVIFIIISFVGILVGLVFFSKNQQKKQLYKEMIEKSKECDLTIYINEKPEIDLFHFKDSELKKMKFEIIRSNQSVKDTIILDFKNEEFITSINIPFKTFLKSDTIVLTINNEIQYNISNFQHRATELYGMFGPVAISDCFLIDSYTINDNQNTREINKFYGKLKTKKNDSIQRISSKNKNYQKIIANYKISKKQTDSIGKELNSKYNRAGYGLDFGIEINNNKSYYLKGILVEEGEIEIIKINTETGEFTKGLKNYPIENE